MNSSSAILALDWCLRLLRREILREIGNAKHAAPPDDAYHHDLARQYCEWVMALQEIKVSLKEKVNEF
jgi:hypothetical protein